MEDVIGVRQRTFRVSLNNCVAILETGQGFEQAFVTPIPVVAEYRVTPAVSARRPLLENGDWNIEGLAARHCPTPKVDFIIAKYDASS